ncbi:hypothetical protein D3C76_1540780 [compost metagenome]
MEAVVQCVGMGGQQLGGALHQLAGHRHDLATVFGVRNEQVRAHQAITRMLPAHQHFHAGPAVVATAHHRLKIGQKLLGLHGAL